MKHLEELFPDSNLVDVCLDIRMSMNGASDPWQEKIFMEVLDMLKSRLAVWHPCRDDIDFLVKLIVEKTVKSCEDYLANDPIFRKW